MITRVTTLPLALTLALLGGVAGAVPARAAEPVATAPVAGGTASAVAPAPEAKPEASKFPLHASAGLTNSVGSATFVPSAAPNPTVQSLLSLSGSAKVTSDVSLSLSERIGFEWTNSDSDTYNHQIELTDPRLGVSWSALSFKDLGLGVALSAGYSIPLSLPSRNIGSAGGLGAGARVSYSPPALAELSTYGSLSGGVTAQVPSLAARYAAAKGGDSFTATNGQVLSTLSCADGARPGDVDNLACASVARNRWGFGLGASYAITEQVSVALDLSYTQTLSQFSAPASGQDNLGYNNADLVGAHAINGLAPSQSTVGSLGVSWAPLPWFALSGGLYSAQPFLTSDNKNLRFPLWDFVSPANNFSSVYFDTTFSI